LGCTLNFHNVIDWLVIIVSVIVCWTLMPPYVAGIGHALKGIGYKAFVGEVYHTAKLVQQGVLM
jgi:hypothetical protein